MVSLARRNLLHDRARFFVAQAGVMFAVVLVTIQLGVYFGFGRSTTALVDASSADLWVAARDSVNVDLSAPIGARLVARVAAVRGVASAEPLICRTAVWKGPDDRIELVRVVGFDPHGRLFRPLGTDAAMLRELDAPYTFLVDRSKLSLLGLNHPGDLGRVGNIIGTYAGTTHGAQSIVTAPFLYTSLASGNAFLTAKPLKAVVPRQLLAHRDALLWITPPRERPPKNPPRALAPDDDINFVLVRVTPGEDVRSVAQRIEAAMPDLHAFARADLARATHDYWLQRTSLGFIVGLGAIVGIIVGMAVVGQILYAAVNEHLREFGTLKAMGAPDSFMYGVVMEQAVLMALLGFVPGILVCFAVAWWTSSRHGIDILIDPTTAVLVFACTVAMCVVSSVFALQAVTRVDPAIVFKA